MGKEEPNIQTSNKNNIKKPLTLLLFLLFIIVGVTSVWHTFFGTLLLKPGEIIWEKHRSYPTSVSSAIQVTKDAVLIENANKLESLNKDTGLRKWYSTSDIETDKYFFTYSLEDVYYDSKNILSSFDYNGKNNWNIRLDKDYRLEEAIDIKSNKILVHISGPGNQMN